MSLLREFGRFLADAGLHQALAPREDEGEREVDLASLSEPLRTIARLFTSGQAVRVKDELPADTLSTLEALGLLRRSGDTLTAGEYRLVSHLGLFLFCHRFSPSATLYYGNDSLALARRLLPVEGSVLDLCAGAGAQALVCARSADPVTAVDVEPLAQAVCRINAEMNGIGGNLEYLLGNLYEPVAGRRFDRICSNPPFMPVPPNIGFPVFADGGPDGLAIVRRVLAGLPEALAPDGRCDMAGSVLGDARGPDLSCFEQAAAAARLSITLDCLWSDELDASPMLDSCIGTTIGGAEADSVREAFRAHFRDFGATHLYCFLLTARHSPRPAVYSIHGGVQRVVVGECAGGR